MTTMPRVNRKPLGFVSRVLVLTYQSGKTPQKGTYAARTGYIRHVGNLQRRKGAAVHHSGFDRVRKKQEVVNVLTHPAETPEMTEDLPFKKTGIFLAKSKNYL